MRFSNYINNLLIPMFAFINYESYLSFLTIELTSSFPIKAYCFQFINHSFPWLNLIMFNMINLTSYP